MASWPLVAPPRNQPSPFLLLSSSLSPAKLVRIGGGAFASPCHVAVRFVAASGSGASQRSSQPKARVRTSKKSRTKGGDNSAWEASLGQLESDVENNAEGDEGESFTEEELLQFQQELEVALGQYSDNESLSNLERHIVNNKDITAENKFPKGGSREIKQESSSGQYEQHNTVDWENKVQKEFEVSEVVRLEKWQLRRLAAALELGRRRVQVKSLAAEVGLDRKDVLSFLKNPPVELLTMSNLQEDILELEKDNEAQLEKKVPGSNSRNCKSKIDDGWASRRRSKMEESRGDSLVTCPKNLPRKKRIKKQYLATFELVFKRTKWPTVCTFLFWSYSNI
eukprot:c25459_g1_i1 orf=840-1853(-)